MRPFHPPRPNPNHPYRARPGGDPGPRPLPGVPLQHPALPPPVPNLANPMAAAAAANPFIALQLLGQAQQLQNLGFLAAAALQQQQQQQQQQAPFFPGGFPPNPNRFAPFHGGPAARFNDGGAFRLADAGICGPRPPGPMMSPAGKGCNNLGGGAPRPMLNGGRKERNNSGGSPGEVNRSENKADGMSDFSSKNGGRNKITDQKTRFNSVRDSRDSRQFGASRGRGRGRQFNQGRGRASSNWRDINPNLTSHESAASGLCSDSPAPPSGGRRKRPPIIYDANEVKQWLEARKKNYPTSVNVNKKLSQSQSYGQNKDKEAQMRRQELKEVLAKQQELGFELPELPPGYLSETENQGERKSKWNSQRRDSHFGNRTNINKRPRFERGELQYKRPKAWNDTRRDSAVPKTREPTLLQKLLSSDIKRDRHRLLHAFKFMALNNFFEDWPDRPLEFPSAKVNQMEVESTSAADDLENAEMTEGISLDLKENGDRKELSPIGGESIIVDHNEEDDDDDQEEDGNSADGSYEDAKEDGNSEEFGA